MLCDDDIISFYDRPRDDLFAVRLSKNNTVGRLTVVLTPDDGSVAQKKKKKEKGWINAYVESNVCLRSHTPVG